MKRSNIILLIILFSALAACNSETFQEHEIGDNFIDESTEVRLIDTFTIKSSTVKMDSLPTSGAGKVLFGAYEDKYFGKLSSDFYATVGLGGAFRRTTLAVNEEIVEVPIRFDSLVFVCYTTSEYLGDTIPKQNISIHRLTEEVKIPDNQVSFYSHNTFKFDPEPLGSLLFDASPVRNSKYVKEKEEVKIAGSESLNIDYDDFGIRVRLDDALGLDIVKKVNSGDDIVLYQQKWSEYLKGIVLKAGEDNTAMLTLNLSDAEMKIRLYYTYTDYSLNGVRNVHDFPVTVSPYNFTNYKSDRSETPQGLDRIVKQEEELNSEETDNLAFIQGGIGFLTKINIPYLENLNTLGLTGGVLRSELIFHPKAESFDDEVYKLPKSPLVLHETDENNQILSQLPGSNSNSGASSIFVINDENRDESYYSVDITSYVNNKLLTGQKFDDGLLISLPFSGLGYSMERLVIDNDPKSDFRIKLRTTYVVQN